MSFSAMLAAGFGLSLDAFAAAIGQSFGYRRHATGLAVALSALLGLVFAIASSLAILVGGLVGRYTGPLFHDLDHWVAFALMAGVGLHMFREAWHPHAGPRLSNGPWIVRTALIAVATSIDAVVVGISLALLSVDIFDVALVVGLVHFLLAMAGGLVGRHAAPHLGRWANVVGGLMLIGLGASVVYAHMSA